MQLFRCQCRRMRWGGERWHTLPHDRSHWSRWHIVYRRRIVRICQMFIVKAQSSPKKNQTLKLKSSWVLPYQAPYAAIVYQTSFLRRDFWYLNTGRAALLPRALLNPFAPFSAGQRVVYVLRSYRIRCVLYMRFSAPAKQIYYLTFGQSEQPFGILCIWTNFDCATDLARIPANTAAAAAYESDQLCNVFRANVINLRGKLPIVSSFAVCLWSFLNEVLR